jgi:hypothetical protein
MSGASLTEIKNHLGHEKLGSTMVYLRIPGICYVVSEIIKMAEK